MFIVCGICLHVGGFVTPVKTGYPGENISGYATTTGTFTFKKSSWSLCGYPNDNDTHIFFHHLSVSTLYSIVSYYKAGQNLFLSVSC